MKQQDLNNLLEWMIKIIDIIRCWNQCYKKIKENYNKIKEEDNNKH